MKKINIVLITESIEFVNSINNVLLDFDNLIVSRIYSSIEMVGYLEKEIDFQLVVWDTDNDQISQFKMLNLVDEDFRVIVVSSNAKDAIEAFNIEAVDFILKPEIMSRISKSLYRALNLIEISNKIDGLSKLSLEDNEPIKIIPVASLNDISIIPVDSIIYLESKGRYTLIYTQDGQSVVSSKNLGVYEKLLTRNNFFRIHHSYIVNVDKSVKVQKKDGVYLEIINNKHLPISKRRVEGFYKCLGIIS